MSGPDPDPVYQASHIKRSRSTKAEMQARRDALLAIVYAMKPMTVRQVFYQATVRGLVEKSEAGYAKVQTDLVQMRKAGELPYHWLADNTRWQRKPDSYRDVAHMLEETAAFYRKNLWARGYASLSFLASAADYIKGLSVPTFIYHLGDYDPSGVNAGEKIEQTLREMAPAAEIHFERLAVNLDQIREWCLPTRPTKTSDTRAKNFGDISVELDAIQPDRLRELVDNAITAHLPQRQFEVMRVAEESERAFIKRLSLAVADGAA